MYGVQGSEHASFGNARRAIGRVWADIIHAQRRAAELNTPWLARRRSADRY
jgi:hypothetical protein